jgi:D-amino-acid oxidase
MFLKPGYQPRALVIGAGVSGLTTALSLRRRGFSVTVVSEKFAPAVTSAVAGALWEWPPSVCGRHHDDVVLERAKSWCVTSYNAFDRLAKDARTGVFMRKASFYFRRRVDDVPHELAKMNELKDKVRGFTHGAELIRQHGVNPRSGIIDAYAFLAPMIDTDAYLAWLQRELVAAGCEIVEGRISANLSEQEHRLRRTFHADVIVNCAGLGSIELARDHDLTPHRGALIRVRNDGKSMPRITEAHCVAHDTSQSDQDMIFIVPRGADMLLLGGLVEPDEWRLNIDLENYAPIRAMLERCIDFLPVLANAQIDETEAVRVGLRPFRKHNVRLERELGTRIAHNYGHGGAGVTLSWGCASEVVRITEELLELQPLANTG